MGVGLFTVLLPQRCAVCRLPGVTLCARCRGAFVHIAPPICECCGAPGPWPVRRCAECAGRRLGFAHARSAIVYDERARALVGTWKERGRRDLARVAADLVSGTIGRPEVDAVCFVPGERDRTLRRGYVTAHGLAYELSTRWQLALRELLRRPESGAPQRSLPRAARRSNVTRAFAATRPAPPRVCLIDDVYTTGATASACARALRAAGAVQVEVVCLARAIR